MSGGRPCAVGPCSAPRVEGSSYCPKHGPTPGARGKPQKNKLPAANSHMICPHCGIKGRVRTRTVKVKKGVSGGKATAALMTGGASLFAVGLSRKAKHTEAKCGQCGSQWVF